MLYAADRLKPVPGARSTCPSCGEVVLAKCGQINIWHWAHLASADCDAWTEPIGQWHLDWQVQVPEMWREVVMGPHRADIVYPIPDRPIVVELQHSAISVDDIRKREAFYGRMVWLFDARDAYEAGRLYLSRQYEQDAFSWRWKQGRRSIAMCQRPVLLDTGLHLINVRKVYPTGGMRGWGVVFRRELAAVFHARPAVVTRVSA